MRYVTLSDLFPNTHRTTRYRWRRAGKLPKPDLVIGNREYYREDRFAPRAEHTPDPDQDHVERETATTTPT